MNVARTFGPSKKILDGVLLSLTSSLTQSLFPCILSPQPANSKAQETPDYPEPNATSGHVRFSVTDHVPLLPCSKKIFSPIFKEIVRAIYISERSTWPSDLHVQAIYM